MALQDNGYIYKPSEQPFMAGSPANLAHTKHRKIAFDDNQPNVKEISMGMSAVVRIEKSCKIRKIKQTPPKRKFGRCFI